MKNASYMFDGEKLALAVTIQENIVVIENEKICNYDGSAVILTILDLPYRNGRKRLTGTDMAWKQSAENMLRNLWRK